MRLIMPSVLCLYLKSGAMWTGIVRQLRLRSLSWIEIQRQEVSWEMPNFFRTNFTELLERRHLADYYPYGTDAPNEAPLDFAQAAQEAVQFARHIIEKTREYIKLKEAGTI